MIPTGPGWPMWVTHYVMQTAYLSRPATMRHKVIAGQFPGHA
jgi:hypothetical protein